MAFPIDEQVPVFITHYWSPFLFWIRKELTQDDKRFIQFIQEVAPSQKLCVHIRFKQRLLVSERGKKQWYRAKFINKPIFQTFVDYTKTKKLRFCWVWLIDEGRPLVITETTAFKEMPTELEDYPDIAKCAWLNAPHSTEVDASIAFRRCPRWQPDLSTVCNLMANRHIINVYFERQKMVLQNFVGDLIFEDVNGVRYRFGYYLGGCRESSNMDTNLSDDPCLVYEKNLNMITNFPEFYQESVIKFIYSDDRVQCHRVNICDGQYFVDGQRLEESSRWSVRICHTKKAADEIEKNSLEETSKNRNITSVGGETNDAPVEAKENKKEKIISEETIVVPKQETDEEFFQRMNRNVERHQTPGMIVKYFESTNNVDFDDIDSPELVDNVSKSSSNTSNYTSKNKTIEKHRRGSEKIQSEDNNISSNTDKSFEQRKDVTSKTAKPPVNSSRLVHDLFGEDPMLDDATDLNDRDKLRQPRNISAFQHFAETFDFGAGEKNADIDSPELVDNVSKSSSNTSNYTSKNKSIEKHRRGSEKIQSEDNNISSNTDKSFEQRKDVTSKAVKPPVYPSRLAQDLFGDDPMLDDAIDFNDRDKLRQPRNISAFQHFAETFDFGVGEKNGAKLRSVGRGVKLANLLEKKSLLRSSNDGYNVTDRSLNLRNSSASEDNAEVDVPKKPNCEISRSNVSTSSKASKNSAVYQSVMKNIPKLGPLNDEKPILNVDTSNTSSLSSKNSSRYNELRRESSSNSSKNLNYSIVYGHSIVNKRIEKAIPGVLDPSNWEQKYSTTHIVMESTNLSASNVEKNNIWNEEDEIDLKHLTETFSKNPKQLEVETGKGVGRGVFASSFYNVEVNETPRGRGRKKPFNLSNYDIPERTRLKEVAKSKILVHENMIGGVHPVKGWSDLDLNDIIEQNLKRKMGMKFTFESIQTYCFPAIRRMTSVIACTRRQDFNNIGFSGFAQLYLPVVLSSMNYYESDVFDKGPIVLILCAARESARNVYNFARMLCGHTFSKQHISLILDNKSLIPFCKILITTPKSFVRRANEPRRLSEVTGLQRLNLLVLDEANVILESFKSEFHEISQRIQATRKKEGRPPLRYIVATEKWIGPIQRLIHSKIDFPVVCFKNFIEAAIYGQATINVHQLKNDGDKLHSMIDILLDDETYYTVNRTIIICNKQSEMEMVANHLKNEGCDAVTLGLERTGQEIYDEFNNWRSCASGKFEVLVIHDNLFADLYMNDVMVLINFSLPTSLSAFSLRLFTISGNLSSPILDINKNEKLPYVYVFAEEGEDDWRLPRLMEILRRRYPEKNELYTQYYEATLQSRERYLQQKQQKSVELCKNFLSMGYCRNEINCLRRHTFSKRDAKLDPKFANAVQLGEEIMLKILNVYSSTSFSARLMFNDFNVNSIVAMKMVGFFQSEPKEKSHVREGKMYATVKSDNENDMSMSARDLRQRDGNAKTAVKFARCIILEKTRHHYAVEFIDHGEIQTYERSKIRFYELSEELEAYPPQAITVYLSHVRPFDDDYMWDSYGTIILKSLFRQVDVRKENAYIVGKVKLLVGRYIWLEKTRVVEKLSKSQCLCERMMINSELRQSQITEYNPEHLPKLFAMCDLVQIKYDPLPDAQSIKTAIENETKTRVRVAQAFLEVGTDFQSVYLLATQAGNSFFLAIENFNDLLQELKEDMKADLKEDFERYKRLPLVKDIFSGVYCIAYNFEMDLFDRVEIKSLTSKDTVEVWYIDEGYSEELPVTQLCPIKYKYIERLPAQSIPCRLYGVNTNANESLIQYTANEDVILFVKCVKRDLNGCHAVLLGVQSSDTTKPSFLNTNLLREGDEIEEEVINESDFCYESIVKSFVSDDDYDDSISNAPGNGHPKKSYEKDNLETSQQTDIDEHIADSDSDYDNLSVCFGDDEILNELAGNLKLFEQAIQQQRAAALESSKKLKQIEGIEGNASNSNSLAMCHREDETNKIIDWNVTRPQQTVSDFKEMLESDGQIKASKTSEPQLPHVYTPTVIWKQQDEFVIVRIQLSCVKKYDISFNDDKNMLHFRAKIGGKKYELNLEFYKSVEDLRHKARGLEVFVKLKKTVPEHWDRLLLNKKKPRYVQGDADVPVLDDNSDDKILPRPYENLLHKRNISKNINEKEASDDDSVRVEEGSDSSDYEANDNLYGDLCLN